MPRFPGKAGLPADVVESLETMRRVLREIVRTPGRLGIVLVLWILAGPGSSCAAVLDARDFGVVGDGVTDDGPAISRMVAAARNDTDRPTTLRFSPGRSYRVASIPGPWLFEFDGVEGLVIEGGGAVFLLDREPRFLSLTRCGKVRVCGLKVDHVPLPFVDGTVTAVDAARRRIEVRLAAGAAPPTGGPTKAGGEQAFFALLWEGGEEPDRHRHVWVERIEAGVADGTAVLTPAVEFKAYGAITAGQTRISLPVPGLAHRRGPGAMFRVSGNKGVCFEDIELWSAPWFGFEIDRNEGEVVFRRAHIRPKPGSGRLLSTWRDGFHVKGNRGALLWEDCIVSGMGDDAFNISTHSSVVSRVLSPTRIEVKQKFPLLFVPWRVQGPITAADEESARLLGNARVLAVETRPNPAIPGEADRAPDCLITLDRAVEGWKPGTMVWNPESANPRAVLRNCHIGMSCRFQAPVILEGCTTRALMWFYSERVEGVFPAGARITGCTMRRGRGNDRAALIVSGAPKTGGDAAWAGPRAFHDIVIENNRFYGDVIVEGVENLRFARNRIETTEATLRLHGNPSSEVTGNTGADGAPLAPK